MSKNGLILLTPTSIAYAGTSATISANGSVSFSGLSSLSLNGVFTADYDNYQIIWWWVPNNIGADALQMRLRASGSDNAGASSYKYTQILVRNTTIGGGGVSVGDLWRVGLGGASSTRSGYFMNIYGPYLPQPTAFLDLGVDTYQTAEIDDFVGIHDETTAYDGFTISPYHGPTSGRIAVYGMRK
jgi:hypothetical protein